MIKALMPAAPAAPDVPAAPAAPLAPGKSFSSILKTSVNQTAGSDDTAAKMSSRQIGSTDCSPSSCQTMSTESNCCKEADQAPDGASDKQSKVVKQGEDSSEVLQQIMLQMTVIYQQTANQASVDNPNNDCLTGAATVQQNLQSVIGDPVTSTETGTGGSPAISQLASLSSLQNLFAASATDKEGAAGKAEFRSLQKSPAEAEDLLFGAMKGSSGNESANAVFQSSDSSGAEAQMQSFRQAGEASAVKIAALEGNDITKSEIEAGPEKSASSSDNRVISASAGLHAQSVSGQDSFVHEQSSVQEVVPSGKLSSVDALISKALDSGQKNLVIRIDPPDLGSMHIRLSLYNGVLKADVRVDSASVKDAFNLALPQIKTSLENSGIKINEFNIDVREDQYRNNQERNNRGQQQRQGRGLKNGFSDFFA